MIITKIILIIGLIISATSSSDQDPKRFEDEISELLSQYEEYPENPIIFAGSSSFRLWKDMEKLKAPYPILNHGFGGSTMNDLNHYLKALVLNFSPSKVFIYEGDNDIAEEKDIQTIMVDTRKVIEKIRDQLPETTIYLVSAKPSPSRWQFKDQYIKLNNAFQTYALATPNVEYVNVWDAMLDKNGKVRTDIFIEDDLHMNAKGYKIWKKIFAPLLD